MPPLLTTAEGNFQDFILCKMPFLFYPHYRNTLSATMIKLTDRNLALSLQVHPGGISGSVPDDRSKASIKIKTVK